MTEPADDRMPECGSCRFFAADDDQSTVDAGKIVGTCHRYPPMDHPYIGDPLAPARFPQFPIVLDGEWCGEHVAAQTVVIEAGNVVEHEPRFGCATCGHGMSVHRDNEGHCSWITARNGNCVCQAFTS